MSELTSFISPLGDAHNVPWGGEGLWKQDTPRYMSSALSQVGCDLVQMLMLLICFFNIQSDTLFVEGFLNYTDRFAKKSLQLKMFFDFYEHVMKMF